MSRALWAATADLDKWDPDQTRWVAGRSGVLRPQAADFRRLRVRPYERVHVPEPANLLVTEGLAQLTLRLLTTAQVWDNTHCGMGVGTSTTVPSAAQTDLQGTKRYNNMDASYPTQSGGTLTFKATYGTGEAEFAWEEYGVVVANTATAHAAGATKNTNYRLLNRKAPAGMGTKSTGMTWTLTVTVQITSS